MELINTKRLLDVHPINRARAGIDQVLYLAVSAAFEYIYEAHQVTVYIGVWVGYGVTHTGLGSKVASSLRSSQ